MATLKVMGWKVTPNTIAAYSPANWKGLYQLAVTPRYYAHTDSYEYDYQLITIKNKINPNNQKRSIFYKADKLLIKINKIYEMESKNR